MGINFTKIGPLVNYHGERWPAVIKVTDMLDRVAEKNPDIWNLLTNRGCFLQTGPINKIERSPAVVQHTIRKASCQ